MGPGERLPAPQRMSQPSGWARLRVRLWVGAAFVPAGLDLLSLIFHIQLSGAVGEFVGLAVYVYFGALLAPSLPWFWSLLRANPGVLRLRVMRRVFWGFAITIIGITGVTITDGILDQRAGPAFLISELMAFGGIGFIFVALFVGLLDASKDVIERYRSEHAGVADTRTTRDTSE